MLKKNTLMCSNINKHTDELCKTAAQIKVCLGTDSRGDREPCIRWGGPYPLRGCALLREDLRQPIVNKTVQKVVCGGDAALSQVTLDTSLHDAFRSVSARRYA